MERRRAAALLWWTKTRPDWREAVERFEHLHDHGPGPFAFHFKDPYGPDGDKTSIDRARVRELAALNAERNREILAHVLSIGRLA
jgi:hypothetical protein